MSPMYVFMCVICFCTYIYVVSCHVSKIPLWISGCKDFVFLLGICHCSKPLYGVQFHPEVDLTKNGIAMLRNFLYNISGCSGSFTVKSRELQCINYIKEKIGNAKVLVREIIPCQDISNIGTNFSH